MHPLILQQLAAEHVNDMVAKGGRISPGRRGALRHLLPDRYSLKPGLTSHRVRWPAGKAHPIE